MTQKISVSTNSSSLQPLRKPPQLRRSRKLASKHWLWVGLAFVAGLFYLSVSLGTYRLSLAEMYAILSQALNGITDSQDYFTLVEYRLPRAILAIVLGAALALGGVLVQAFIRNPLASPEILGINNGSGMAAVILISFFPSFAIGWLLPVSFMAGLMSFGLLWVCCGKKFTTLKMALIGVALSALYAAITHYVMLVRPLEINLAMLWLTGSLWGRSWFYVYLAVPVLVVLLPIAFFFGKDLDLLGLGEAKAQNLGVNVRRTQVVTLLIAVALSATAVAICGPIAFMGLVAPHLARKIFGGRHHVLIPTSMLVGSLLLQTADLLARIIHPPIELPAGILTAVIGAPYFFVLLIRKPQA